MLTTIKVYACYAVKMYKNKPKNISKQGGEEGGGARCAGLRSAFVYVLKYKTDWLDRLLRRIGNILAM